MFYIKKIIILIFGVILLGMTSCGTENTTSESISEDYYINTEIPTFQNVTGIPCTGSYSEKSLESDQYVPGYKGYKYKDVSIAAFQEYRDQLSHLGAEETDFSSSNTAILIFYEFNNETFGVFGQLNDANTEFEEVMVAFS